MGIKITTDDYGVRVWRNDKFGFPQYSISVGKTESGRHEYKQVQFRKGIELANGDEIYINDAFPTLRTWTDKQTGEERCKEVWMITDWSYRSRHEPAQQSQPQQTAAQAQETFDLPDTFAAAEDDIPF